MEFEFDVEDVQDYIELFLDQTRDLKAKYDKKDKKKVKKPKSSKSKVEVKMSGGSIVGLIIGICCFLCCCCLLCYYLQKNNYIKENKDK